MQKPHPSAEHSPYQDASDHAEPNHKHSDHHGGGRGDHTERFRRLFWITLAIAIPAVAFSPMFGMILGYEMTG